MIKTKKKATFGNSFQKAITASFIRMPEFYGRFRDLINERVIDDPDLGCIVTATREITEKTGGALPTRASLEHRLPKLKMLIKDLYMTDVRDREFVADEVAKFCRMQAFKDALVHGARKLKELKEGGGKESAMSEAMTAMQDALMVGMDVSDIGEFLLEGKEARQDEYLHPEIVKRIPTGLKHLDDCLGGGLAAGELGIIMSLPKCGKSSLLMNIGFGAANSLNRYKVVHYSLEMSQRKILKRYDMRITGSLSDSLKTNPQTFVDGMDSRIGKLIGGNVLVKSYPTRSAGYSTLCSHLSRTCSLGFKPDIIIVDYVQIMKPERRLGEAHHEIASCAEDLRRMAGEFGVPCWTAQQVNRGGMLKARPGMADASGAIETAHIADAFMVLAQSQEERQQKTARLVMEALREEASGSVIRLFDDRARMLFKTLEIVKESVKEKKKDDFVDPDAARLEKARKLAKAMRS